jgi:hypothetical protein
MLSTDKTTTCGESGPCVTNYSNSVEDIYSRGGVCICGIGSWGDQIVADHPRVGGGM